MREKQEREMCKESNICLDVLVGLLGGAHDVHAMTPGVVQLRQLHEVKHLDITKKAMPINTNASHAPPLLLPNKN
jgi:hypothetical protein